MAKRNYTVAIFKDTYSRLPVLAFPLVCPNCCQAWDVSESWIINGSYYTGGKEATCEHCGYALFEVIDTERPEVTRFNERMIALNQHP